MLRSQRRTRGATLLALSAVYLAAGKLGLSLALVHASASPVWPPTGIALAAFLVLGRNVWPAIFAGAFLVNATTEGNLATSLGIAAGNTLEGMVGAELVWRFASGTAAFDRPRDIFRFVALAAMLATAISPTIGVTSLCLGGFARWPEYGSLWLTWWLGDAGGAIVVTPALVLWANRPQLAWTRAQQIEAVGLVAAIAGIGAIAFAGLLAPLGSNRSLSFLCIPPTIWAAFRFGRRGAATAVLILSGLAVWATVRSAGPFPAHENVSLVLLQLFMGVVSATSLSLAAVLAQQRHAYGELARQAVEFARSNAELDEFARVISHDLKAPLRGISSLATWIVEDGKNALTLESREHLSLLSKRAKRLSRMIDGVLAYSRVGRSRSALGRVNSRDVVEEIVDALGPLAGVSVRIEGQLPVVRYDRTRLTQVLQNLIQNGVQHIGRQSGEVVVSCREAPEEFEFSIRDDGVGITRSNLHRVFQMFFAVDPAGDTTGVGLAIVRKIVEMHGGNVSVASTPGQGATFRFSIPKRAR
jgi:signal transduction histidine kinase